MASSISRPESDRTSLGLSWQRGCCFKSSSKVISILQPFLKTEDNIVIYDTLPLSLKLSQPKLLPPQFVLSWKDVVKLKPELQNRIHINTVMTYLKNQEFPTSDGVTGIYPDSANQENIIFKVDQEMFSSSVLLDIINRIEMIPSSSCFFKNVVPENVVVEYSSPNIAKPFHFGHFRSTIVGNFIANICSYVGHKVTKLNYVGDWGLQYGILAEGFNRYGCEDMLHMDPLNHLFQLVGLVCLLSKNTHRSCMMKSCLIKQLVAGVACLLKEVKVGRLMSVFLHIHE
ncbi:probable arginine--tRNA ligase, mitochondrial [Trichonephila clavipes]|nr:probable arginine--tRNA ligase, mitochondrial [Trichonephila clavipes]